MEKILADCAKQSSVVGATKYLLFDIGRYEMISSETSCIKCFDL